MPDESGPWKKDGTRAYALLRARASMGNNEAQLQTFVEMVLTLLEDRFPCLGKDSPASCAESVDQLNDCC
jgi:hypothetical protein